MIRAGWVATGAAIGWVALLVALPGCGGETSSGSGEDLSYLSRSGPLFLRPADGGDAPQAEVSGEVAIEGECVALLMERNQRAMIVWPAGTTWDDERSEVRVDDDLIFGDGDRLGGSGAYVEEGPSPPNEWNREILAQVEAMEVNCGPLDLAVSVYPTRREPADSSDDVTPLS